MSGGELIAGLLPCPHCGGTRVAPALEIEDAGYIGSVQCASCWARGPRTYRGDWADVLTTANKGVAYQRDRIGFVGWNTRAPTPPAAASEVVREDDHRDRQIETLRRALAWHGDPQRMATTREEWQQEVDDAIVWVKANPEPDRLSFSSFATPTATHNAEALIEALEKIVAMDDAEATISDLMKPDRNAGYLTGARDCANIARTALAAIIALDPAPESAEDVERDHNGGYTVAEVEAQEREWRQPSPNSSTVATIPDLIAWLTALNAGAWSWTRNSRCKYVEIGIDTRSGAYRLVDRESKPITASDVHHQNGVTVAYTPRPAPDVERKEIEAAVHGALVRWSNGIQPKMIKVLVTDAVLATLARSSGS